MPLSVVYFGHHQYRFIMLHHLCVMVIHNLVLLPLIVFS